MSLTAGAKLGPYTIVSQIGAGGMGQVYKARDTWGDPALQRAVELDPNFAIAYARVAVMYSNAGERQRGIEFTRMAFSLVDRVTERERLYITSQYYNYVTGDLDKTIEAYQAYAQMYPRDLTPHVNLGVQYGLDGQWEKAVEPAQEAMRLEPKVAVSYSNLVREYIRLDRFDEARAIAERARAQNIDSASLHDGLLFLAYIQNDEAAARKETQWAAGRPEEYFTVGTQSLAAEYLGEGCV